ncbi:MAG: hypothetical protein WBV82_30495 [Myxococcaceae bacterium]
MRSAMIEESELTLAAEALEKELREFEKLAEAVQRAPLGTEKQLGRAAKTLNDAAESDARLVQLAGTLLNAITRARTRQQEQAAVINARAEEIQARAAELQSLMERFGDLGRTASELNQHVQNMAASHTGGTMGDKAQTFATALLEVQSRMSSVAEEAGAIAEDASKRGFSEIARDSDSLRQQLLAARNRLHLLQQSIGGSA